MAKLLLLFALAASAFAQAVPPIGVPGLPEPSLALRQYLDLTNEQVATIVRLQNEVVRFRGEKLRRQVQVNAEIAQEMRRETLDPMAIGVRFVELEAIRREIDAEQQRVIRQIQALLTPAQRTRIQSLQEILRVYPVACEALSLNLMSPPESSQGGVATFLAGAPVCGGFGGPGIRTGDFGGISFVPYPGLADASAQK